MVRTEDACEIIKYALQNEIKVYLDGGWGVDALLKRESRIHNDIDLFVELKHYHDYIYVIKQHGFEEVNTDYTTDGHTPIMASNSLLPIPLFCIALTFPLSFAILICPPVILNVMLLPILLFLLSFIAWYSFTISFGISSR